MSGMGVANGWVHQQHAAMAGAQLHRSLGKELGVLAENRGGQGTSSFACQGKSMIRVAIGNDRSRRAEYLQFVHKRSGITFVFHQQRGRYKGPGSDISVK